MCVHPPELIHFSGEWQEYEDHIYSLFVDTVVRGNLTFEGARVAVRYTPETKGKHHGFWHVISESESRENKNEDDRIPDLQRCERILWIAWLISHYGDESFSWWKNSRGRETHVVIWAEEFDFAVILAERENYYLLKTAYCLKPFRRKQFEKERNEWRKKNG